MSDNSAHRDFFLLGDRQPALRDNEVATIADAIAKLKSDPKAKTTVRGIGLVRLTAQVRKSSRTTVFVLSAGEIAGGLRFFVVPETDGKLQAPVALVPRPAFSDKKSPEAQEQATAQKEAWTVDRDVALTSKVIYDDRRLTVLQIVSGTLDTQRAVYWFGLSKKDAADDVIVASGEDFPDYIGCGRFQTPASVVRVLRTDKPFKASVEVQPTTLATESDNQPITWDTDENGETAQNCLRRGEIRWSANGFVASLDDHPCSQFAEPRFVKIDEAGNVTLSKDQTP